MPHFRDCVLDDTVVLTEQDLYQVKLLPVWDDNKSVIGWLHPKGVVILYGELQGGFVEGDLWDDE
jgi:hypothetical protein